MKANVREKAEKQLLRKKYEKLGYEVRSVRKQGAGFTVSFGRAENGRGLGPKGLASIRCNAPTVNDFPQIEIPFPKKRSSQRVRRGLLR